VRESGRGGGVYIEKVSTYKCDRCGWGAQKFKLADEKLNKQMDESFIIRSRTLTKQMPTLLQAKYFQYKILINSFVFSTMTICQLFNLVFIISYTYSRKGVPHKGITILKKYGH